jgi:SAM-dependent methyltransferase
MTIALEKPMSADEAYGWRVGRWSRQVGRSFIKWLGRPSGLRWLEIGCGTGALSAAILETARPSALVGIDPSDNDIGLARKKLRGTRAEFHQANAEALPFSAGAFDVVASGLVLNFLSDADLAMREMQRVAVPGGCIAGYVWDFGGEMQVVRRFWDAAIAVDGGAAQADQAVVFPLCKPEPLRRLFVESGLRDVDVRPISATARFPDFATYWGALINEDWTGGRFLNALPEIARHAVRKRLHQSLPPRNDGSLDLEAGAWAVRGTTAE